MIASLLTQTNPADAHAHGGQFLRDALALGDKHPVVATTAIFSHNGIKLVDTGTRVTSALHERLVRHKLLTPIERCLTAQGGVDAAQLVRNAQQLLAGDVRFERISEAMPKETLLGAFRHVLLLPPLAFKLTVAREQRAELFAHSVEVAVLAVYLHAMSSRKVADLAVTASAGLLQDIGLLHVAPDILAPGRALSQAERSYLYTHPITAHLIVREFMEFNPVASTAILQHHERLDGSGYPYGLQGDRISGLGKILMMADSGAALLKSGAVGQGGVALRLLHRKFEPALLDHLSRLFESLEAPSEELVAPDCDLALRQLHALAETLAEWDNTHAKLKAEWSGHEDDTLLDLVDRRVLALERSLLESGFVANQLESFADLAMQAESGAQEMREMAREALWQLKEVTLEARRRSAASATPGAIEQSIARWLGRAEERFARI